MTRQNLILKLFFGILIVIIFKICWFILNDNAQKIKYEQDPLDDYIKLHNSNRKRKFFKIVSCRDIRPGYANKIYNVLSALIIAILTDSSFYLIWPEIEQFVQPPLCDVFHQPKLIKPIKISVITSNSWGFRKNITGLINKKLPNVSHSIFNSNKAYFFYLTSNPIFYPKLLGYKLVKRKTIESAKTALSQMSKNVEPFLTIGFEVGHRLIQKFWKLNANFNRIIEDFYNKKFRGFFIIGIQIRTQFLKRNDSDLKSFINCALQIEKMVSNNLTFKWFLTSDSGKALKKITKIYPNKTIIGKGAIGHILWNKNAYFRTVMDSELLAKSDEIIITGGSTFGFVSSIRKGKLPFYIDGIDSNYPCKRMNFSHLPRSKYGSAIF